MTGNCHVRCGAGENSEIISKNYLSLFGTIPEFEQKLATMRKYEISCTIILQNLAQIKTMYKDSWESLTGNCDSFLFIGGQEQTTLEYISKKLGKETIVTKNKSRTRGKSGSTSMSYNSTGRELMTADEVARMKTNECILFIRGLFPFFGHKYNYPQHPNYKYTGDADDKYLFDVSKNFTTGTNLPSVELTPEEENKAKVVKAAEVTEMRNEARGNPEPEEEPKPLRTVSSQGVPTYTTQAFNPEMFASAFDDIENIPNLCNLTEVQSEFLPDDEFLFDKENDKSKVDLSKLDNDKDYLVVNNLITGELSDLLDEDTPAPEKSIGDNLEDYDDSFDEFMEDDAGDDIDNLDVDPDEEPDNPFSDDGLSISDDDIDYDFEEK